MVGTACNQPATLETEITKLMTRQRLPPPREAVYLTKIEADIRFVDIDQKANYPIHFVRLHSKTIEVPNSTGNPFVPAPSVKLIGLCLINHPRLPDLESSGVWLPLFSSHLR
jgi:hypothetical protein